MLHGKTISLIIPCYNEAIALPHQLPQVPPFIDELLIVDNNSTDNTAEIARAHGAKVVAESRKGYGAAYKCGFKAATGEIFVTLDGDGTYPLEEIERLVGILETEKLDFISACRFPLQNPENMDKVSQFGNRVLTLAAKILFGNGIQDSQSGMWVFRSACLQKMRIESDGMPLSEEIKIEALKRKLRFKEVHIPYHARLGEKKIRKFRDGWHNLWFLVYLRLRK
jgi:hypothetical protein